jgi:Domain of Unknown Function (DUF928)
MSTTPGDFKPMINRPLLQRLTTILQVGLAFGLVTSGLPLAALAQTYVPPDRGLPGRREGGGTRGCWSSEIEPITATSLTALVPQQNFGTTTAAHPTVFLYIPLAYAKQAVASEFTLNDAEGNELYRAIYRPNSTSGVIRISMAENDNLPPLEIGKDYSWSFALVCDISDRSADLIVESWIQRIEATPQLTTALQTAQDPATLLATEGIWYDAIAHLADSDASDEQWRSLLNSVGLDTLNLLTTTPQNHAHP